MSVSNSIKILAKSVAKPILRGFRSRWAGRAALGDHQALMQMQLILAARSVAASGDHSVILPTEAQSSDGKRGNLRIGFFGNIANNAYIFVKCLRRLGLDAELVIEDGLFDAFIMNRPFWEDLKVECNAYEEGLTHESEWRQPEFVRRVAYNPGLQARYAGRFSAIPEVQALYKREFGIELPPDRAYLLSNWMGHWPYLLAMARYDVIQFSGAPISMGAFCPKPFVSYPTGGDLFISPFEENLLGLLMRAGYRCARGVLLAETNYPEYLDRLAINASRYFTPLMVDTDTYAPLAQPDLRARWSNIVGGHLYILGVCRQSWLWKGNDRLIRAFAQILKASDPGLRLVLMAWGPDLVRSQTLIAELGIERFVIWEKLCSKPLLRQRQQAADIVVDQFVMEGYGASVLESMAASRPVVLAPIPKRAQNAFHDSPPFLGSSTPAEIASALTRLLDESTRNAYGVKCREWVLHEHGYRANAGRYLDAYAVAAQRPCSVSLVKMTSPG